MTTYIATKLFVLLVYVYGEELAVSSSAEFRTPKTMFHLDMILETVRVGQMVQKG
jgi:hypothetical protein